MAKKKRKKVRQHEKPTGSARKQLLLCTVLWRASLSYVRYVHQPGSARGGRLEPRTALGRQHSTY